MKSNKRSNGWRRKLINNYMYNFFKYELIVEENKITKKIELKYKIKCLILNCNYITYNTLI